MAWLKIVHIASAVLWLGNFVVTGVWALRGFARRNTDVRAFSAREILFTDVLFTLCFGSAVTISGIALASIERVAVLQTLWTRAALVTIGGAGIVWLFVLLPLEIALYRRASRGEAAARIFAAWNVIGWLLSLALFGVIYLMVAKPV